MSVAGTNQGRDYKPAPRIVLKLTEDGSTHLYRLSRRTSARIYAAAAGADATVADWCAAALQMFCNLPESERARTIAEYQGEPAPASSHGPRMEQGPQVIDADFHAALARATGQPAWRFGHHVTGQPFFSAAELLADPVPVKVIAGRAVCPRCGSSYKTRGGLGHHLKTAHRDIATAETIGKGQASGWNGTGAGKGAA